MLAAAPASAVSAAGAEPPELSASLTAEGILFRERAAYPEQRELAARRQPDFDPAFLYPSLAAESRLAWSPFPQANFAFAPLTRYDRYDRARTAFDVRELKLSAQAGDTRLRIGMDSESWGVMDFVNVTDFASQRDNLDAFLSKKKLAQLQAAAEFPAPYGYGRLQVLAQTFFRPMEFPGPDGRLRPPLPIRVEEATYGSDLERWRPEGGFRYSASLGQVDVNLTGFHGYAREPEMRLGLSAGGPFLRPHYGLMNQAGMDAVSVVGDWVLRTECALRGGFRERDGDDGTEPDASYAASFGAERTLPGILGRTWDLTLISEYLIDTRAKSLVTPFTHSLFAGARLTLNDSRSTEATGYYAHDWEADEPALFVSELSSRLWERLKASIGGVWIIDPGPASPFRFLAQDSHITGRISFYY